MAFIRTIKTAIKDELDRVAQEIEIELKAECPKRTGRTADSIRIVKDSEWTRFVGTKSLAAKYADEGNGGSGQIIRSKRKEDRLGRKPGKLQIMNGMYTMYVNEVHGYEGSHFVKTVADRHR